MSETTKKTAWPTYVTEALDVEAALMPLQVRLDAATESACAGQAPLEVYEAFYRAERTVSEVREVLRRLARNLEGGEFRKPCSAPGCDDDQENRTGLCYKHRQEAAEEVKWANP